MQEPIPGIEAPPRPAISEQNIREAAERVAKDMGQYDGVDDLVDAYTPYEDGYRLARRLEDDYYWDVDASMISDLDNMDSIVLRLNEEDQKRWAEEYKIQPPLPNGTEIEEGVIVSVCSYSPASYRVKETGCTRDGRFLIIKFEDAKQR